MRRFVRCCIVSAMLVIVSTLALAQADNAANYPTQPLRFVVPFSAGGGTDVIMRLSARHMTDAWKVNVIVDNRVGAGGVVGSQHVTQQKPDGRTFLAVASAFAVRAAIDRNLPYDVNKDFTGVGQMARSPSFMVVSPSHGFGSLKELIAYAKTQPKGILYGSAGVAWVSTTAYAAGSLIDYGGRCWQALASSTGAQPDTSPLSWFYVPAFQAKDLALALDLHVKTLPSDQQVITSAEIANLVRLAYMLDAFGDIGNRQQISQAFSRFAAAAKGIDAGFSAKP